MGQTISLMTAHYLRLCRSGTQFACHTDKMAFYLEMRRHLPVSLPQRCLYRGRIVELDVQTLRLPNGAVAEFEIVRHPGGAAVVAVDATGAVCLLRQYRPVLGAWIWELPAGKLDPGERPLATALRELREEAGLVAASWEGLGRIVSSPGVFTEVIHLYLARGLAPVGPCAEEHECFEVHWLPFAEALGRARRGEICDAKTVAGLFRAAPYLRGAAARDVFSPRRAEPISARGGRLADLMTSQ